MQVINENKKAKLITGEIINFYLVGKSEDDYPFEKNITYVGQGYLFENIKDDEIYHFWIFNKNYSVFDIQKGDKILVKINNESIWVVMSELIGNSGTAHCLYTDGSNVNIPFRDIDILYVEEGNTGLSIIKSAMAKEALLKGGFHLITYVNTFDEMPLKKGDYITAGDGYDKENNLLNIRNNHKVLNQGDLIFESWTKGCKYATVRSVGLNKSTFLAINAIYVTKVI